VPKGDGRPVRGAELHRRATRALREAQPIEAANLWNELLARSVSDGGCDSLVVRAWVGLGTTYAQAGRWTLAHEALRAALGHAALCGRGLLQRWTQARAYWVALSVARLGHPLYADRITPDLDGRRQDRVEAAALCAQLANALGPAWLQLNATFAGPSEPTGPAPAHVIADVPLSTPLPARALLLCRLGQWEAAVRALEKVSAGRASHRPALEREEAWYLLSCSLLHLQRPQEALTAFARYSALACQRQRKSVQGLLPRPGHLGITPERGAPSGSSAGLSGPQLQQLLDPLRSGTGWPVGVASLAAKAGVSPRVLNGSFRRHLGTTALAGLGELRLLAFRAGLLDAGRGKVGVAALAAAFGYSHAGRLAAQYRKRFGETPAQTLERAVADTATAAQSLGPRRTGAAHGD
jgi:AraC-like DNA-binding protein